MIRGDKVTERFKFKKVAQSQAFANISKMQQQDVAEASVSSDLRQYRLIKKHIRKPVNMGSRMEPNTLNSLDHS